MRFLNTIKAWYYKEPPKPPNPTEKFDQVFEELKSENQRMSSTIQRLEPADVLRSLVVNMNSSKNR